MNTTIITPQGVVSGSSDTLVEAAAALLTSMSIVAPRAAADDRVADLVAAVRIPWARLPVETLSAA